LATEATWTKRGKFEQELPVTGETDVTEIEERILEAVGELPVSRRIQVLDFALFLQTREGQQGQAQVAQPVVRLEDLYGDFWPDDEPIDEFINTVRQWRKEDIALHRELE
jgi:hypothetical protein